MDVAAGRTPRTPRPHTAPAPYRAPCSPAAVCPLRDVHGRCGGGACQASRHVLTLPRGAYLFAQGEDCDAVHCVLKGALALEYVDAAGGIAILRLAKGGDLLGCADLFNGYEHSTSARALEDSVVCQRPAPLVSEAIDTQGSFARQLLKAAAAESHAFGLFAQRMATLPVEARILSLLEELSAGQGHFPLPVAKRDLAYMAGTRPEVLSRTLVKLQKSGAARVDGHMVSLAPAIRPAA